MDRATVLYDESCGLCRWWAEQLRRRDHVGRLRFVALDTSEADELLPGLTVAERRASWHLVGSDGRVVSGGAAIPPVFDLLPGGRPLAAASARFPRLTDRAYRWVAAHRGRLGWLLRQRACAVDPAGDATPRSRPHQRTSAASSSSCGRQGSSSRSEISCTQT